MTSLAFLVDQLFAPIPGGMGSYARELIPALVRADPSLDITLFHSKFDPGATPPPELGAHRTVELDRSIRTLYPGWALAKRPGLPEQLAALDLLHTPLPAAIPPAGPNQRLVVTIHDIGFVVHPAFYPRRWRLLYRAGLGRAVGSADLILAVSRHTAEDLIRRTHIDRWKVHVTPLAPSLPPGDADVEPVLARLKVRPPYVLSVGTLEPRKNLVRLVRAYRRMAGHGAPHTLVLAGPMGWGSQSLLHEIETGEAPGEIVLTGRVPPDELDALYRAADAFVYPSLYEGFGLPVLEAMARGVPTIVSTSSSLPEVAGEAAVPVDPRSTGALAEALERVTTDRYLAARLSEAGRARAARFTWDETARLTLEAYKSVL
jgi:glycosyltransferase involved in cell wall biosynthesis